MTGAKRCRDRVAPMMAAALDQLACRAPRRSRPCRHWRRSRRRGWRRRALPASVGWPASSETKSAALPAAMPAGPAPSACAPPASAASNSARPVEPLAWPSTLRSRRARRCEYSSCRNSSATPISTLESEPMPKRPPCVEEAARGKHAVAEIGLGDRAKAGDRAARGQAVGLGLGHVGGVDQAPAPVDLGIGEQPFDRPRARPGDAVLDLLHLLGDMDVDRAAAGQRRNRAELLRRHGAQAVRRDADHRAVELSKPRARLASSRRAKRSRSLMKRRWPSLGAAPPKPECA